MKRNKKRFYVYAYLDPRKHGKYKYGKYKFDYEPFYIGKGCGKRLFQHLKGDLKRAYNPYKDSKIKNILRSQKQPIIIKLKDNICEDKAFRIEIKLIKTIGMKKDRGPLTNLYEGGYGATKSIETRNKISKTKKRQFANGDVIHPLIGTTWSKETREKIRKTRLKNPYRWTQEQKDNLVKIRLSHKNKSQTIKWKVTSPKGKITIIYGLGAFCRNHNLSQRHMWCVANKTRPHHKQWKCEYYNP